MSIRRSASVFVFLIAFSGCASLEQTDEPDANNFTLVNSVQATHGWKKIVLTEYSVGNEVQGNVFAPNCISWRPDSLESVNVTASWNSSDVLLLRVHGYTDNEGVLVNGTSPLNAVVVFDLVESTELQVTVGIPKSMEPTSVNELDVRIDYGVRGVVGEASLQRCYFSR